jgi:hypothetical protein
MANMKHHCIIMPANHRYNPYPERQHDRHHDRWQDMREFYRPREKQAPSVRFNDIHEDLHRSIDSFKSVLTLKLTPAVEVEHVITHLLNVSSEDYRLLGKLTVYTDSSGKVYPLDSWMEIVRRVNLAMKTCVNGKMIKTYYADDTLQRAQAPGGTHVFAVPREITETLIQDALKDADNVYWNPKHRANKFIHMIEPSGQPSWFNFFMGIWPKFTPCCEKKLARKNSNQTYCSGVSNGGF